MKPFRHPEFDICAGDETVYGFYGRQGGVSTGIYAGLNCGTGSHDDAEKVAKNRSIVANDIGAPDGAVSSLWQCHSALCIPVKSHVGTGDDRPRADALATDVAGLAIGILTADCCPVLFIGRKEDGSPVIGAAHAGWGGALGGVLDETVSCMKDLGAGIATISACLGPCIMQPSYEVSADYAQPFLGKHQDAGRYFQQADRPGHLRFDMPGYVAFRLRLAGVTSITHLGLDTYADEQNFYSFRRATHRGETDYGRQLSAIMIHP